MENGDRMENITLGNVAVAVAFIVALLGGFAKLYKQIKILLTKLLEQEFKTINNNIRDLQGRMDEVDMQCCKNFLVNFLADLETKGTASEVELERFYEQYEHYVEIGGNSYVKHQVEKLESEGKL